MIVLKKVKTWMIVKKSCFYPLDGKKKKELFLEKKTLNFFCFLCNKITFDDVYKICDEIAHDVL